MKTQPTCAALIKLKYDLQDLAQQVARGLAQEQGVIYRLAVRRNIDGLPEINGVFLIGYRRAKVCAMRELVPQHKEGDGEFLHCVGGCIWVGMPVRKYHRL
jgi:hypothetical protein